MPDYSADRIAFNDSFRNKVLSVNDRLVLRTISEDEYLRESIVLLGECGVSFNVQGLTTQTLTESERAHIHRINSSWVNHSIATDGQYVSEWFDFIKLFIVGAGSRGGWGRFDMARPEYNPLLTPPPPAFVQPDNDSNTSSVAIASSAMIPSSTSPVLLTEQSFPPPPPPTTSNTSTGFYDIQILLTQLLDRFSGNEDGFLDGFKNNEYQSFCDEIVPAEIVSQLTLFAIAKTIEFQNDECFSGFLDEIVARYQIEGQTATAATSRRQRVGLYSSEDESEMFTIVHVVCESLDNLELFLLVRKDEEWCAVISAGDHPFVFSNRFQYEGSDGSFAGFDFVDDGEATTVLQAAERAFSMFVNNECH